MPGCNQDRSVPLLVRVWRGYVCWELALLTSLKKSRNVRACGRYHNSSNNSLFVSQPFPLRTPPGRQGRGPGGGAQPRVRLLRALRGRKGARGTSRNSCRGSRRGVPVTRNAGLGARGTGRPSCADYPYCAVPGHMVCFMGAGKLSLVHMLVHTPQSRTTVGTYMHCTSDIR